MYKTTKADFGLFMEKCRDICKGFPDFKTFWPKKEDLKLMGGNIDQYYNYLVFLLANNEEAMNVDEVNSCNMIRTIIRKNTIFEDEAPEYLEESYSGVNTPKLVTEDELEDALDEAYEEAALNERLLIAGRLYSSGTVCEADILKATKLTDAQLKNVKDELDARLGI